MKTHTDEAIKAKAKELFSEADKIEVAQGDGVVVLTISAMYSAPGMSFATLDALARFFDTKNVETESEFSYHGCESCDYGSEYGFDLYIRPGDSFAAG
jgi:hypothetical protein